MSAILVVEDELTLQDLIITELQSNDFSTIKATNGEEGLNMALSIHPDLIILDIIMPKMDGITMMKKLRLDQWGKNVPIIILTNVDPDDNLLKEINLNPPSYYLLKSNIKLNEMIDKVKELISKKNNPV